MKTHYFNGSRRRAAAAASAITVGLSTLVAAAPPVTASPLSDGATSQSAAASCWEIKQLQPESPDGTYWLNTPALGAPEQFHCDMTTDGGGWVLIGRGREGWSSQYEGTGPTSEVHEVISGTDAFAPKQLGSKTVDGLLDNGRVDALSEGIRVRRATNVDGTAWQDARFRMADRDRWVWTFGAEHRVGSYDFGVASGAGSGGQTNNFGRDSSYRRIDTRTEVAAQAFRAGWAFGSNVAGTDSTTSHLWSNTSGGGAARPFTQVYIRPRLTTTTRTWLSVPDSGLSGQSRSPLLTNGALAQTWGVTGLANGVSTELTTEAQAFTQVGSTVFVGGNFRYVQRGSDGLDRTEQPYLAAFDLDGNWISTFRPQLNGIVRDLANLPNGKLIVGGEFSQANGESALGVVALDPATGATDPDWALRVENRVTGGSVIVRALDVEGSKLYIGGAFTHLAGGSRINSPVFARNMARVATDATPDSTWNPNLNGTVVDLDAAAAGDRAYAAGYFTQSNGQTSNKVAAISSGPGAAPVLAWAPSHSHGTNYQQAIVDTGTRVYHGGAQHNVFGYDTSTFERRSGNITKAGGDFQVAEEVDGIVYAGCHCNNYTYSNAYTWSNVGSDWTQADKIGFLSAATASTGDIDPEFNPRMQSRNGYGAWAMFRDSNGNAWVGGSFTSAVRENGANQWVGGFVRFRPRDIVVPSTPGGLTAVALSAATTRLTWAGSSDNDGAPNYQVIRDDRVVATTSATTLDVPAPTETTRYFVRAVDATGNLSASTVARVVEPGQQPPPPQAPPVQAVALGSTWNWVMDRVDRGTAWKDVGYDDADWNTGPARIGYKIGGESTVIDWASLPTTPSGGKPITAYYRRTFQFTEQASRYATLTIDLVRDDGAAVYLNGVELVRDNLPAGPLTTLTNASATVGTISGARTPVTFQVPASALVDGTNTIAVEVHQNHAWGGDMSFDLALRATS